MSNPIDRVTSLAVLALTIIALGAPSTKMAYAAGGSRVIEPAHKYSIAAPVAKWMSVLVVLDAKGKPLGNVGYRSAGPWDSRDECNAFVGSDEAIRDAAGALLDEAVEQIGDDVEAVGVLCVPVQG